MIDSYSNISTYANAQDSKYLTILAIAGDATPEPFSASIFAATVAYSAANDAGKPLQYLSLKNMLAANVANRFTDAERNILIDKGASTIKIGNARDKVALERVVTTYKTNQANAASTSYQDLETIYILINLRYQLNNRLLLRFPRFKLGTDADPARSGVVRPKDVRAELTALGNEWLQSGLIADLSTFQFGLNVAIDANNSGRLVITLQPKLIGQLRQIFSSIQFRNKRQEYD